MESFRNPDFVERYEDVIFDLETPIVTTIANGASQKKKDYKLVADNIGEVSPFDWYNARIIVDFKVFLLANGGNIAVEDHNGIVNGSHSLINNLKVELNGQKIYDCYNCNRAVNIKNLLDYTRQFSKDMEQISCSFSILTVIKKRLLQKLIVIKDLLKERLCLGHLQM